VTRRLLSLQQACLQQPRSVSTIDDCAECSGMKFHDFGKVRQEVRETVIAGVRTIFVPDTFFLQFVVQGGRSFFEAVVVVLAAVEIDCHLLQSYGISLRQDKRAVLVPVPDVDRPAEHRAKHSRQRRSGTRSGVQGLRRFGDQRGALRAHRREQFGMCESEAQRSVAAHRNWRAQRGRDGFDICFRYKARTPAGKNRCSAQNRRPS